MAASPPPQARTFDPTPYAFYVPLSVATFLGLSDHLISRAHPEQSLARRIGAVARLLPIGVANNVALAEVSWILLWTCYKPAGQYEPLCAHSARWLMNRVN